MTSFAASCKSVVTRSHQEWKMPQNCGNGNDCFNKGKWLGFPTKDTRSSPSQRGSTRAVPAASWLEGGRACFSSLPEAILVLFTWHWNTIPPPYSQFLLSNSFYLVLVLFSWIAGHAYPFLFKAWSLVSPGHSKNSCSINGSIRWWKHGATNPSWSSQPSSRRWFNDASRRQHPRRGNPACDRLRIRERLTALKQTSEMFVTAESEKAADPRVIQRPRRKKTNTQSNGLCESSDAQAPAKAGPKRGWPDRASGGQEMPSFSPESGLFEKFKMQGRKRKGKETKQIMHSFVRN